MTGAAGYIAPRHLKAIRDTGNRLIAVLDPHDSVGILDGYFDDVDYFREFERFDRFAEMQRRGANRAIDYVSICSPNYLHDAHIRFAFRIGADAICEKPLVLNPWNLDALAQLQEETGRHVYTILQLRLHPSIVQLRERVRTERVGEKYEIVLTYITSRGNWYLHSWKGDQEKSGGIAMNIGVHFFDMLMWIFGTVQHSEIHLCEPKKMAGYLELTNANVRWYLSVDKHDLPFQCEPGRRTTYRSISIDGEEFEFSEGFGDLHTTSYAKILEGNGFTLEDARASVEIVHTIRHAPVAEAARSRHPYLTSR
jgi:UDP-N-acetyl-2-amino-2-deoxyglucuronate dehydrogenase